MRISDWSSDVCSSDLSAVPDGRGAGAGPSRQRRLCGEGPGPARPEGARLIPQTPRAAGGPTRPFLSWKETSTMKALIRGTWHPRVDDRSAYEAARAEQSGSLFRNWVSADPAADFPAVARRYRSEEHTSELQSPM